MAVGNRVSLRGLLLVLSLAGLLILLVASLFVGLRATQVSNEAGSVEAVYEPAAEDVATLSLAASDMERGLSLYVLGGHESDLRPFVDGERRSTFALDDLTLLLGDQPEVAPLIAEAKVSRERWLAEIARPAIKAQRSGDRATAEALVIGDQNQVLYDQMVTDSDKLRHTINATRGFTVSELSDLAAKLTRLVVVSIIALVLAVLATTMLMFRWVLRPLDELRHQLREVAGGDDNKPITPSGPTELAAVGQDAEAMRRQLVAEIDEARSAREALEHREPLVAAIRRELSMPTDPQVTGFLVHGEVRAAEGVLAGDWWDCVAMPTGEAALIITDIAGHGPEAGISAMRIKHLMAVLLSEGAAPADAITTAARSFSDEADRIATAAVVCVDPTTGRVRWANGGHHPPVLLRKGGVYEQLEPTGPLLSWIGGPWEELQTQMLPNDVLLAFSDGLLESHDAEGDELDLSGVLSLYTEATKGQPPDPEEGVAQTLARARERATDWDRDDITLVALTMTTTSVTAPEPPVRPASPPPPRTSPKPGTST